MDAMRAHTDADGVMPSQERRSPAQDRTTGPTLEQIRAAQRDPQAAASIYATWFEPVYLYCLRHLGSSQAAEDATSRIFERVLTALPDYQPNEHRTGATFRSWLFAIAHNTIVDHHRRRRFHLSLDQLLRPFRDRPPIELPTTNRPPLDQVIVRETDQAVRDALGHLPDIDGFYLDRSLPSSPWVVLQAGGGPTDSSTIIVDRRTGEVAARLDDADLGTATSLSPAHDFSVIVITGHTGDEATTGYVLDANRGESWEIPPPDLDLSQTANIHYTVSPDGSLLVASNANSPASSEANPGETWISPLQPEPEWTSIEYHTIDAWLYDPENP